MYLYIPSFTVLGPVFLTACHTTGFSWVPLYDIHWIAQLSSCAMYYCILLGLCRYCSLCPSFSIVHQSLHHLFRVMYLCVYVICAPSHLSPHIPFLYTVVMHTLSICRFSNLRWLGRFSSDCIDSIGTCLEGLLFTSLRLHLPSFSWPTKAHARFR